MSAAPLTIVGVPGSPYSRKLRAVLRYRRIPHVWVQQGAPESRGLPKPPVDLLPQLIMAAEHDTTGKGTIAKGAGGKGVGGKRIGGSNAAGSDERQAHIDTTPIIRDLEARFAGRAVVPDDPALAFLDYLIEDYADEWLTKAMFHYRWAFAPDIARAQSILPRWFSTDGDEATLVGFGETFGQRQIGRRWVVGSNETTAPVIEASYRRLLEVLRERLAASRFVLGARPGAGDFGLYGQLTQLAGFDPTPRELTYELAPRVSAWVDVADDLSGLEPKDDDWISRERAREDLSGLLGEIGRVYPGFLIANAAALEQGAEEVVCKIDGVEWRQRPFPYQAKCLGWLRDQRAALSEPDRDFVDSVLLGTGCEALFAD